MIPLSQDSNSHLKEQLCGILDLKSLQLSHLLLHLYDVNMPLYLIESKV